MLPLSFLLYIYDNIVLYSEVQSTAIVWESMFHGIKQIIRGLYGVWRQSESINGVKTFLGNCSFILSQVVLAINQFSYF